MWKYIIILLSVLAIAGGCAARPKTVDKTEKQIKDVFLPGEDSTGAVNFQLYFLNSKGPAGVEAEERSARRDELLGKVLLDELIKGPAIKSSLKPILPPGSKVLSFSIRDSVGYVNLENKAIKEAKIDENWEKGAVAAIVHTLCQLPSIEKVQIMFDNQKSDTFAGSVDISKALSPEDFKLK
jgi:spore germination protein GerM